MVRQLTIWFVVVLFAVPALAENYIMATGENGTDVVYTGDRMVYTNWLNDCQLWMPFPAEELAGTYYDYSRQGNDGSQGTANLRPAWNSGSGGTYVFDGTDDYIISTDIDPTTEMAITAWIYCHNVAADHRNWFSKGVDGGGQQYLGRLNKTTGAWYIQINTAANYGYINANFSASLSTWYNIVVTYSVTDDLVAGYVNGVLLDSRALGSGTYAADNDALELGRDDRAAEWFDGNIDDVRIYDRALTSNEVYNIYMDTKSTYGL